MIQEPRILVSDTHLERRTVHARRRAVRGDWSGAASEYEAIWPLTKQLSPCRRLRFISQYAEVLLRSDAVFERLRTLAGEAALLCYRHSLECRSTGNIQRHVDRLNTALLQVARDVGAESAMGQKLLEGVWAIASAMLGKQTDEELPEFRAVNTKNGEILWLFRSAGDLRYHLIYPSIEGPAN